MKHDFFESVNQTPFLKLALALLKLTSAAIPSLVLIYLVVMWCIKLLGDGMLKL